MLRRLTVNYCHSQAKDIMAAALCVAGQPAEAMALCKEVAGVTTKPTHSLASAQIAAGDAKGAALTLRSALASMASSPPKDGLQEELRLRLALVQVLSRSGNVSEAVAEVDILAAAALPEEAGDAHSAAVETVRRAVLAVAAGAAVSEVGKESLRMIRLQLHGPSAPHTVPLPTIEAYAAAIFNPELQAELLLLESDAERLRNGPSKRAISAAAKAVHVCPWNLPARQGLATAVAEATPQGKSVLAPAARFSAASLSGSRDAPKLSMWARLAPASSASLDSHSLLRRLQAAAHSHPSDPQLAAAVAAGAVLCAGTDGGSGSFRAAVALCRRAIVLATRQGAPQPPAELLLLLSEAQLNSRGPEVRNAVEAAEAGLNLAAAAAPQGAAAHLLHAEAQRQLARCRAALGEGKSAAELCREAGAAGSVLATLQLAEALCMDRLPLEAAALLSEAAVQQQQLPATSHLHLAAAAAFLAAGEVAAAKREAEAGRATAAGGTSAPRATAVDGRGQAAEVVAGAVGLVAAAVPGAAEAEGLPDSQLQGLVRSVLSGPAGLQGGRQSHREAAAVAHLLLAILEDMGTYRKKEERARNLLTAAEEHWSRSPAAASPAVLHRRAAMDPAASQPTVAKALHMHPGQKYLWSRLQALHNPPSSTAITGAPIVGSHSTHPPVRPDSYGKSDAAWDN